MNFPVFSPDILREWVVVSPIGQMILMQAHFMSNENNRVVLYIWTQDPKNKCVNPEVIASFTSDWSVYLERLPEDKS